MAITSINLGKIKFNWKGAWALGVAYVKDDVVRYSGSSYVCTIGHTSATSWVTNSSKFELMAEGTTPTTTKGDLIYRDTGADTRLGIGASGQVLTVSANGLPVWGESGVNQKIYYVSPSGSNSNSGQSWGTAFATIKYACTQATGPAAIMVASGTYAEQLPIVVPSFVAVIGDSQRTTIIGPASGYEQLTMWKLSDGALLNKMCFIGLTGYVPYAPDPTNIELAAIGGVYVALNGASPIATKSPYVIECTAKSAGGVGALVDGALHASGNKSMVFHGFTVILDDGVGYWVKDNGKSEIVSCFTYFCHMGYAATGGGKIRALNGNNSYGTYGALSSGFNAGESTINGTIYGEMLTWQAGSLVSTFADGDTITGGSSGTTGTVINVQPGTSRIYYKKVTGTGFTAGETVTNGAGASMTIATGGVTGQTGVILVVTGLSAEPKPGGSISITGDTIAYVIQSSSGWTNSGSKVVIVLAAEKAAYSADSTAMKIRYDYSQVRLTGHDFLSIGTGGVASTNYPGVPAQAASQGNEVVELFPGRVFYVSTDQDGNFRVGEYFKVDQATGRATLNATAFDLSGLTSLRLGSIGAQLGELVNEFSSDVTLSGNSNSAIPTERAVKQYFTQISSNNVPSVDDVYTLGTASKRWNHIYVGAGSLTIGSVTLTDNAGTLEVKATSSGNAAPTLINAINNGNSSVSVASNSDITLTANGATSATFSSTGVVIAGTLTVNGTTTTINSNTLTVDDVNIVLGSVSSITGLTGTITSSATSSVVTGLTTTSGLIPGMVLTKTAGVGVFGTTTLITSIDSPTQITVTGQSSHTAGGITFTAGGATDTTAEGGGFTLKGTTDKTFTYVGANTAWTSNQNFNIASGKTYKINGTDVLSSTALGSGVTSSSLQTVGTLTSLSTGAITTTGALALNTSGSVTTDQTTFSLVDATATTVNAFGASTTTTIGATTGTHTIRNTTVTLSNATALNLNGASPGIVTSSTGTAAVFNTNALTGNLFGAATAVTIGATSGTATIRNTTTNFSNASAVLQINGTQVLSGTTLGSGVTGSSLTSVGTLTGVTISTGGGTNIANTMNIDTNGSGTARYYSHGSNTSTVGSHEFHLSSSNGSIDTVGMTLSTAGTLSITGGLYTQGSTVGNNLKTTAASGGTVVGGSFNIGQAGGDYDQAGYNFVSTGTNAVYNYRVSDTSTIIQYSNSGHLFKFAASGTAGNPITYTTTMTVGTTGNVVASGTVTSNSDVRLKTNVETITTALDKVVALRGVMFDRISTGVREMGVIAQEVEAVVPELVFTDADGIKSVAYANTVALLIEAIKEQQQQINELKKKVS